ncbi:MAG TPA: uridine kinase, partial [Blastocatellia bacterium]|nr:uridine kinase [Blastocatellia bacterium]
MERDALVNELAAMIAAIRTAHPVRVAIDGVDGAGKTTLADELTEPLRKLGRQVIRASVDGFLNPASVRYRRGRMSPRGYFVDSLNYNALRVNLLDPLGPSGSRKYRTKVFDHRTDAEVVVPPATAAVDDVLICDGVFLQCRELRDCWDFVVWLEASFEITVSRAAARDSSGSDNRGTAFQAVAERYAKRYVPGQEMYL